MSISFDKALGIHEKALGFRAQRAEVLANNMANADTPNYKARDLDFASVLAQLAAKGSGSGSSGLQTTNSRHIAAEGVPMGDAALAIAFPRRHQSTRTPSMHRSSRPIMPRTRWPSRPASRCSTVNSKGSLAPCVVNKGA